MRKLSRFVHSFDLGDHVVLWHALRMQPVFLEASAYDSFLSGVYNDALESELVSKKIFLAYDNEDDDVLRRLREYAPKPDASLAYFILSENCNLACRYCFVGSDACGKGASFKADMTEDVAERAIEVFIRQLEYSPTNYEETGSDIIFFGGEPLLNFETLVFVVNRVRELKAEHPVLANTNFAVITNGTLLDEERILALDAMGVAVSISIDGFSEEANAMRVDKAGQSTFSRVIDILESYKKLDVQPPSLSVTLSEETIKDLPSMLRLIRKYGIKGFGYNVLLQKSEGHESSAYYEEASQFIIDSFLGLREIGVYEDRIMRKLNAFAHARIHFSDCGATAGGQVLFAPDGRIGICQGLLDEEENYAADVWDDEFIAAKNPVWEKWASLIPLNTEECLACEALGICGGGCPVNARLADPARGLHCIDERSCVHAKKTLRFLLEDLYETIRSRR